MSLFIELCSNWYDRVLIYTNRIGFFLFFLLFQSNSNAACQRSSSIQNQFGFLKILTIYISIISHTSFSKIRAKMGWFFTVLLLFIASFANACDRCIFQSKAAHYYEDAPTSCKKMCLFLFTSWMVESKMSHRYQIVLVLISMLMMNLLGVIELI